VGICIICHDETDSSLQASLDGQPDGPICEDCAFWCDGNVIGAGA